MAAPKGNQNAVKSKMMSRHLQDRLEERKLWKDIMDALIDKARDGDIAAIKEVFDRVDGKAHQSIDMNATINSHEQMLDELGD